MSYSFRDIVYYLHRQLGLPQDHHCVAAGQAATIAIYMLP
jgi:hypothetical protein